MTPEQFTTVSVHGIAKIVDLVRNNPGISERKILKLVDNRHAALAYLHLACCQDLIFKDRVWWLGVKHYYPQGYQ